MCTRDTMFASPNDSICLRRLSYADHWLFSSRAMVPAEIMTGIIGSAVVWMTSSMCPATVSQQLRLRLLF